MVKISNPDPANLVVVPAFERLSLADIFIDASRLNQVVMATLALAAAASFALWAVGVGRSMSATPSGAVGGLRYLKGMWAGALLLGFFGASYTLLAACIGLANVRPTPSLAVLAPGLAEAVAQVALGLLAAALAVIFHPDLNARLRRLAAT